MVWRDFFQCENKILQDLLQEHNKVYNKTRHLHIFPPTISLCLRGAHVTIMLIFDLLVLSPTMINQWTVCGLYSGLRTQKTETFIILIWPVRPSSLNVPQQIYSARPGDIIIKGLQVWRFNWYQTLIVLFITSWRGLSLLLKFFFHIWLAFYGCDIIDFSHRGGEKMLDIKYNTTCN